MLGVTHEKAVSLLTSRPDITIVVQRDIASPLTSPTRSSVAESSPRHVSPEKPHSPTRSVVNASTIGNLF